MIENNLGDVFNEKKIENEFSPFGDDHINFYKVLEALKRISNQLAYICRDIRHKNDNEPS